jgi:hypothetical protein
MKRLWLLLLALAFVGCADSFGPYCLPPDTAWVVIEPDTIPTPIATRICVYPDTT